jgi:hypothetical protein
MNDFSKLPIDKDIVIVCSGESRNDVSKEDYDKLCAKYFTIALNFVDNIQPHARIWSDPGVSEYLSDREKDSIYITRERAINTHTTKDLAQNIDYWFNPKKENFPNEFYTAAGNVSSCKWTLYWLLQLLKKYFPKKNIYIIGMDCLDNKSYMNEGGKVEHKKNQNNNCMSMPEAFDIRKAKDPHFFDNVYNCNFFSAVRCMQYKDLEDLL